MDIKYNLEKALFYNDFERVKNILNSPQFSPDWLVDCGDFPNVPTPIYYISQLWHEILPGKWSGYQEIVDEQIAELNRIIAYFEEKFHVLANQPLDLTKYKEQVTYFWGYAFEQPEDEVKEYLWETREELNARGFRNIDIDLYISAYKFECTEVERLLSIGADDTICFFEDEKDSCIYMRMRDDFDEREEWQTHTFFSRRDYEAREFSESIVTSMFGSAGKYRMIKILDKYYVIRHPKTESKNIE